MENIEWWKHCTSDMDEFNQKIVNCPSESKILWWWFTLRFCQSAKSCYFKEKRPGNNTFCWKLFNQCVKIIVKIKVLLHCFIHFFIGLWFVRFFGFSTDPRTIIETDAVPLSFVWAFQDPNLSGSSSGSMWVQGVWTPLVPNLRYFSRPRRSRSGNVGYSSQYFHSFPFIRLGPLCSFPPVPRTRHWKLWDAHSHVNA
jgi:hypothetical protein